MSHYCRMTDEYLQIACAVTGSVPKYSQFNLALCYVNGDGVPQDKVEAAKWYRKAAEQGYGPAEDALKELK